MKLVTILVPLLAATAALATVRPEVPQDAAFDREAIEAELDAFVERYLEAFAKTDPDAIRAVCSTSPSFAWYENGKLRYPSVDRILTVLSAVPDGDRLDYTLTLASESGEIRDVTAMIQLPEGLVGRPETATLTPDGAPLLSGGAVGASAP